MQNTGRISDDLAIDVAKLTDLYHKVVHYHAKDQAIYMEFYRKTTKSGIVTALIKKMNMQLHLLIKYQINHIHLNMQPGNSDFWSCILEPIRTTQDFTKYSATAEKVLQAKQPDLSDLKSALLIIKNRLNILEGQIKTKVGSTQQSELQLLQTVTEQAENLKLICTYIDAAIGFAGYFNNLPNPHAEVALINQANRHTDKKVPPPTTIAKPLKGMQQFPFAAVTTQEQAQVQNPVEQIVNSTFSNFLQQVNTPEKLQQFLNYVYNLQQRVQEKNLPFTDALKLQVANQLAVGLYRAGVTIEPELFSDVKGVVDSLCNSLEYTSQDSASQKHLILINVLLYEAKSLYMQYNHKNFTMITQASKRRDNTIRYVYQEQNFQYETARHAVVKRFTEVIVALENEMNALLANANSADSDLSSVLAFTLKDISTVSEYYASIAQHYTQQNSVLDAARKQYNDWRNSPVFHEWLEKRKSQRPDAKPVLTPITILQQQYRKTQITQVARIDALKNCSARFVNGPVVAEKPFVLESEEEFPRLNANKTVGYPKDDAEPMLHTFQHRRCRSFEVPSESSAISTSHHNVESGEELSLLRITNSTILSHKKAGILMRSAFCNENIVASSVKMKT